MDQRVSSLAADHNQLGGLKNLELTPLILIGLLSVPTGFLNVLHNVRPRLWHMMFGLLT